jgi:tRNA(Arg) A34 adenosine deaminase TadA
MDPFSAADRRHMATALTEARAAGAIGDFPVGAVLVVEGAEWGRARNGLFTARRTTAHAEHRLLARHSARLRAYVRRAAAPDVALYATLAPCLMCFGTAVLHRVTRIVVACEDPDGGATRLHAAGLGAAYARAWPAVAVGLERARARALVLEFLRGAGAERFRSAAAMRAVLEAAD